MRTEGTPCAAGTARPEPGGKGKLNSFQKTMLQWNDMHPYNAVHVVRFLDRLDLDRLKHSISSLLESRGLTGLSLRRSEGAFQFHGGPAEYEVRVIGDGEEAASSMFAEIERQLNTPFVQEERFEPFRFFVVPDGQSFALGLVYFHPIAGAEPVVLLLKELVDVYRGQSTQEPTPRLEIFSRSPAPELTHHPGWLARVASAVPAFLKVMRTSCRPHYRDARNLHNGFGFFSLPAEDLSRIVQVAKAWEVTVNDVFLAVLLQALSPLAAHRRQSPRRRKLSVGTIVNIRRDLGVVNDRAFGLFLGSFVVTHEVPDALSLSDLAHDVRAQTQKIKQARLYLTTPSQLKFARLVLSFFSTKRRLSFYQKNYPLWGGITNMNLNSLWESQNDDAPVDYLRAVSTGPVTPLVLSITTVRDHVNIGVSFRSTVFSTSEIGQLQSRFLEAVQRLQAQPA